MQSLKHLTIVGLLISSLTACGHRTSVRFKTPTGESVRSSYPATVTIMSKHILLTDGDITYRPYRVIGDIKITISKWSILDKTPTQAMINKRLKEEAAKRGADAVIFVRYGTPGIGAFTWGKLQGRGRAVAFIR